MKNSDSSQHWYQQITLKQWKGFFAAWIGYFLDGFDFVLITLVLTDIQKEFHLSMIMAASLVSAAFISRWFGGLVLGAMGDHYGRRISMVISILLFSVGTLLCGFAPSYSIIFCARLMIGLGMAGEYGSSCSYVIESWPKNMRNKASGFLLSGYSIGSILAAQAYYYVVPELGWRSLFFLGIIPIIVAIWIRKGIPEADDWVKAKQQNKTSKSIISVLYAGKYRVINIITTIVAMIILYYCFTGHVQSMGIIAIFGFICVLIFASFIYQSNHKRWPTCVMVAITVLFAFLFSWPTQSLLPTYLKTSLELSPSVVAELLSFSGFGYAVGSCLAGIAGDYFGTRKAYVLGCLLSLIFVFPLFAMGNSNLVLLGTILFIQQMFSQGISGLLPKFIAGYFDTEQRAASLGFLYNIGALGGGIAPVLGSFVGQHFSLAISLASLTFILTAITVIFVGFDIPSRFQALIHPNDIRFFDAVDGKILGGAKKLYERSLKKG